MNLLIRLFLRIEYGWHMVDAYMASNRGDMDAQIHHQSQACNLWAKIKLLGGEV